MTIFLLQNCQNWFLRIQGNTLIRKLFWKTLPRFCGPWAIYFLTFGNFFTERLSKLFCTCSENILKMRIFLIVLFLVHNQTLSKFFSDIRHKFFRKVLKTAFSMFRRTLWRKAFFLKFFVNLSSDFERNHFWIRVEISEKASQNCILRVQKTIWGNRL